MSQITSLLSGLLRWRTGRQGSGYDKMLLATSPFLVPWDCYLLRYRPGAGIPEHTDPVRNKRHYRLNVELKRAREGGEFRCADPLLQTPRIKLFRPDLSPHSVTPVEAGVRYVLSIGWVRQ